MQDWPWFGYDPFLSEDKHFCNREPFKLANNLETAIYVEM